MPKPNVVTTPAALVAVDELPSEIENPHALDLAPVYSKIVVTEEGAMLATPSGVTMLDKADPASRLPRGARIQKFPPTTADGMPRYLGQQLSPAVEHVPLWDDTARGVIAAFVQHFHPQGG